MAIDIQAVRFLLASRNEGCVFREVVTLGRQHLSVYTSKVEKVLNEQQLSLGPGPLPTFSGQPVAEPFFKALGAERVDSLDFSPYQGATIVHDLNCPVPTSLHERFDLVYDGGTLEHVFNFPVGIKNCLLMTKVGGWVVLHTPINNFCGHGFYQFSPELFFRIFCEENGFRLEHMVLHSFSPTTRWYHVADPAVVRKRVELLSLSPIMLIVRARKIRQCDPLLRAPAQADLEEVWTESPTKTSGVNTGEMSKINPQWNPRFPLLARGFAILKNGWRFYTKSTLLNRESFKSTKSGQFVK